jgi:hypothetical protein
LYLDGDLGNENITVACIVRNIKLKIPDIEIPQPPLILRGASRKFDLKKKNINKKIAVFA